MKEIFTFIFICTFLLYGCQNQSTTQDSSSDTDVEISGETEISEIYKETSNNINSSHISKLEEAGLRFIMATYIPPGFQLIEFEMHTHKEGGYGFYQAYYKGANNSCFNIWATNGGVGDAGTIIRQWTVNNKYLGQITLEEFKFEEEGITELLANFNVYQSGYYFFESPGKYSNSECTSISPEESIKIIESWQYRRN